MSPRKSATKAHKFTFRHVRCESSPGFDSLSTSCSSDFLALLECDAQESTETKDVLSRIQLRR